MTNQPVQNNTMPKSLEHHQAKQKPSLLTNCFIGIAKLLAKLPNHQLLQLGKRLGAIAYYVSPHRRHIADINLRICFPEYTRQQRKKVIKEHFTCSGQGIMEAIIAWWKPSDQLPDIEIHGLANVEQALAQGRGVIFLSAHFTCLELVGRLLSERMDFAVIYREQKNQLVDHIMKTARQQIYSRSIDRRDGRGIFRALKDNLAIWLAADQDYGRKHSTFALFFGLPAAFITSPTRLAGKTGAAVIPALFHRLPNSNKYCIEFEKAIEHFAEQDPQTNASITSHYFEKAIMRNPAQYLWIHKRFKTRPEGTKARYYQ